MTRRWIMISMFVCAAVVVSAQVGRENEANIHKPSYSPDRDIPYQPDRIIRTTMHDYLSGGKGEQYETTGRYVTFGLPMKFLNRGWIYQNQAPVFFRTLAGWDRTGSSPGQIVDVHDADGHAPWHVHGSNRFAAHISSSHSPSLLRLAKELIGARKSGLEFHGYEFRPRAKVYWLHEMYCGFEVFERGTARQWHVQAGRIDGVKVPDEKEPPFDHARIFGLPDGSDGYRLVVECQDSPDTATGFCTADAPFNDYVVARYEFDGALLCEIDRVIEVHMDLLRRSVVDEQAVMNEKWRKP